MRRLVNRILIGIGIVAILAILLVVVVIKPWEGSYAVRSGTVYDYVNWVDVRRNGTYMIWTVNVHDSVFCTRDKRWSEVADLVGTMHLWVELRLQTINAIDFDNLTQVGCDPEAEGIQTFRFLSLKLSQEAIHNLDPWQHELLSPYQDLIDLPEL